MRLTLVQLIHALPTPVRLTPVQQKILVRLIPALPTPARLIHVLPTLALLTPALARSNHRRVF